MKNRMTYHITPHQGLINDPNGLVYYKGRHHVFFQWNQEGVTHEQKSWGHVSTADFVNWTTHLSALEPTDEFDRDGCYSGSAIVYDDRLFLFYTGNVRGENGERITTQCLAVSDDGIHFTKKGPVIQQLSGYTGHIRDPKVWRGEDGRWWMVLGAQTVDLKGAALLYQSDDLYNWQFHSRLLEEKGDFGFMWECPDLLVVDQQSVLILSPQGLDADGYRLNNLYHSGYMMGSLDDKMRFTADSEFEELDRGFEFYAPQTYQLPDGRTILYAWMGLMSPEDEQSFPTIADGWIHALTLPRQLRLVSGKLYQQPLKELEQLRTDAVKGVNSQKIEMELASLQSELVFQWPSGASPFQLTLRGEIQLSYDQLTLSVTRTNWRTGEKESRRVELTEPLTELRLFMEESSLEVFVNQGQECFSLRYIALALDKSLSYHEDTSTANNEWTIYSLSGFKMEKLLGSF